MRTEPKALPRMVQNDYAYLYTPAKHVLVAYIYYL